MAACNVDRKTPHINNEFMALNEMKDAICKFKNMQIFKQLKEVSINHSYNVIGILR